MVDECISPYLARALRELFAVDHQVANIRDHFGPGVKDLTWIKSLSDDGEWIVLSADRRITRNKAEMQAFKSSGLIGFFLSKSVYQKPMHRQFMRVLAVWESLEKQATLVRPGAMFEITERGDRFRQL
ncbi:PIN-like domain-containing protein [Aureimonas pseudogalii]|nr:hypothetical protein [Aureimonas pseudogalii]